MSTRITLSASYLSLTNGWLGLFFSEKLSRNPRRHQLFARPLTAHAHALAAGSVGVDVISNIHMPCQMWLICAMHCRCYWFSALSDLVGIRESWCLRIPAEAMTPLRPWAAALVFHRPKKLCKVLAQHANVHEINLILSTFCFMCWLCSCVMQHAASCAS